MGEGTVSTTITYLGPSSGSSSDDSEFSAIALGAIVFGARVAGVSIIAGGCIIFILAYFKLSRRNKKDVKKSKSNENEKPYQPGVDDQDVETSKKLTEPDHY